MDVVVHVDQAAYRRNRRKSILSLLALALIPVAILSRSIVAAVLEPDSADRVARAICIVGVGTFLAVPLSNVLASKFYRCPHCGRRLPRVWQGQQDTKVHHGCVDCGIIWEIGQASQGGGEGGG